MKAAKSWLFLLILTSVVGLSAVEHPLPRIIDQKVLETIRSSNTIPGLKSDEFSALKSEISKTWESLLDEGVIEIRGTDKDVRPYFVAIQAVVEHVLASLLKDHVKTLKGVIHTPMPATALCTQGEISKELVDPTIESDPARLFTVKARTTIVRDYLFKGGDLYIVYPNDSNEKRTEEQQQIYQQELANYQNHLFDSPLNCSNIPTELIGAIYLFEDEFKNKYIFAIKMTQAKDPQEIGNFGLWFGSIYHPAIEKRVNAILNFIDQYDDDLVKALKN